MKVSGCKNPGSATIDRFFTCLVTALQQVDPSLGQALLGISLVFYLLAIWRFRFE